MPRRHEDTKVPNVLPLAAIIAIAVAARLASALYQGSAIDPLPGVTDQVSYHELAIRVVNGHGFSFATGWWPATRPNAPTAHWSYLYVLFLAAVYWLFGTAPLAARLIQAVIVGVLQPLLAYRVGTRLFGRKAGLGASALTAVYLYFVFYGGALVSESLYFVAFLWAIDAATSIGAGTEAERRRLRPWLTLGASLASAALLRQVFLLMVPFVLAWVALQVLRRGHPLLGRLAVTSLVLVLAIAPWTIRNYRAFGQFVLLNTNAGFAFFWGNHPVHGTRFIPIIPNDPQVNYATLLPASSLRGLNEAEVDRALLVRGLGFVRDDPVRYARLSLSRAVEYFKFWPSSGSSLSSNLVRVFSFGLLLPLFVAGLVAALRASTRRYGHESGVEGHSWSDGTGPTPAVNLPAILLVLILAGAYTLVHLLTWTLVRYRLPVDAITMPLAGAGVVSIWQSLNTRFLTHRKAAALRSGGTDVPALETNRGEGGPGYGRPTLT